MNEKLEQTLPLRIGTRGSPLARKQADMVAAALRAAVPALVPPSAIEIIVIQSTGDRIQDRPLADIGGKGLFIKEIEEAIHANSVDIGVHSMKDVETVLAPGTEIAAMLPRADPRDALIAASARKISDLPAGAVVGTTSVRRRAFLLAQRPDLKVITFRGNVATRLQKLNDGLADATLLAVAGLQRLQLDDMTVGALDMTEMPPAVGQGAVGIQARCADCQPGADIATWLAAIDDRTTRLCVTAERAMLAVVDGTCGTPVSGLAEIHGGVLHLAGKLATDDGQQVVAASASGVPEEADDIGRRVGSDLLAQAGPNVTL
jgi:hydroxymethylbilane synthase